MTDSSKPLVSVTAYHSFGGEVEALNTPTIRRLTPSCRHLQRSPDAIWVEPAEWQLLQTLAPHLQRAAAIHDLLSRTRATTNSLGAAVAAAGFAVFLLTEDCRVVFANAKAEDLVRRQMGFRYERGQLAAAAL